MSKLKNLKVKKGSCVDSFMKRLFIDHNQIEKLPSSFFMLDALKELTVRENPIVFPPYNVFSRGCQSVIDYLKDYNVGTEEWNHIKLITIGDEHVGKVFISKNRMIIKKRLQL